LYDNQRREGSGHVYAYGESLRMRRDRSEIAVYASLRMSVGERLRFGWFSYGCPRPFSHDC
jgi:hypothetical protein